MSVSREPQTIEEWKGAYFAILRVSQRLQGELPEARQGILECQTRILALERELAEARQQNWYETAMQESRNRDYYRGLVVKIGELFGVAARTADDGGINEDVLCAKVPDLVKQDRDEAHAAIRGLREAIRLIGHSHAGKSLMEDCLICIVEKEHAPVIRRAMGEK